MGISSALNAARTGLSAASMGIETTSNNVANAATEGYSRRAVRTTSGAAVTLGGHARGTGVAIDRISRASDFFITRRIVDTAGDAGEATARRDALVLAESWFSEGEVNGLSTRLQDFYDSLSSASADPGNASARRAVVTAATRFANGISRVASALVDVQTELESRVADVASDTNERLAEVADLNGKILEAGDPDAAAGLIDRRDQVVRGLAEDLGAEIRVDRDTGEATVLLGGVALVQGDRSLEVAAGENSDGELTLLVTSIGDMDAQASVSGRVGGIMAAWSKIEGYLDQLDSLASDLGQAVNDQHALGYDTDGAAGGDVFTWDSGGEHASTSFEVDGSLSASTLAFASDSAGSVGDIGNLQSMLDIESSELFAGSTQSGEQFLNALVSEVGSDVNEAESDVQHFGAVLSDLDSLRDSVSGVDLDEEAAQLIQYQTAYQAAAKMLGAADELMQTLLQVL